MITRRIATIGLSLALVLGVSAPAGAQTVAELQAQINALMAQLSSLQGGSVATTAGTSFTQNLTVGSTGAQVTALQQMLVSQGHLVMPAGAAFGNFGNLTKAAVAKWQTANGVSPAMGYFGPVSRAKANSMVGTATGGTTTPGMTTGTAVVTTPGVEGILSATVAPTPGSGVTVREGDMKKAVLGLELEADLSDIKVERVKVKLDQASGGTADRDLYREVAEKMYVMDGSTVLATVDLNASTVVEETTGNYYVTITGLNYVVRKDTKKVLTLAVDAQSSFDTNLNSDTWTLTVPAEGIRGVDGAGVNQYAPASGSSIARTFTTEQSLTENATLTFSLSSNSPKAQDVVAASGSDEDEKDKVEVLRFDARAEDDDVTITDLVVDFVRGGNTSTATATTAYLYDGSTLVGSASVVGTTATAMTATFDDIETVVNEDSTKTYTVQVDIRDAGTAATTFYASLTADADIVAENSEGDDITESGSATGETMTVRKVGLEVSLVSKSIVKSSTPAQNNTSTSTVEAKFTLRVKAVGGDIIFGNTSSSTPFVSNAGGSHDDNASFDIFVGGGQTSLNVASTSSVTVPSGVANETNNSFTLQENNTVDIPVEFTFYGREATGTLVNLGSYAVGIQQLNWTSSAGIQESNFMDNKSDWRTSTVQLP